jgi:hypothetical protein
MHPQYELDHVNAVFHQNYRDAYLNHSLRAVRRERAHRFASIAANVRRQIEPMLIAGGARIRPHTVSEPGSATGGEIESSRA